MGKTPSVEDAAPSHKSRGWNAEECVLLFKSARLFVFLLGGSSKGKGSEQQVPCCEPFRGDFAMTLRTELGETTKECACTGLLWMILTNAASTQSDVRALRFKLRLYACVWMYLRPPGPMPEATWYGTNEVTVSLHLRGVRWYNHRVGW